MAPRFLAKQESRPHRVATRWRASPTSAVFLTVAFLSFEGFQSSVAFAAPAEQPSGEAIRPDLLVRLLAAKQAGDFALAVGIAREHLALLLADSLTTAYDLADARYEIAEREYDVRLPSKLQRELVDAERLTNIYREHFGNGNFVEGLALAKKQLSIRTRILPRRDRRIATSLNAVARCLQELGAYSEAEAHFRAAIALLEELYPDGHPTLATYYTNLSGLRANQGDSIEAIELTRAALGIHERLLPTDHRGQLSTLYNNLATTLARIGQYAESDSLQHLALAIHREYADSLGVALDLLNIGVLRIFEHRYHEAESYLEESVRGYRAVLGPDHPDIAFSVLAMGNVFMAQRRFREALPFFEEALTLRRAGLATDHPDVVLTLNHLATCLHGLGDDVAAESALAESARLFESARTRAGDGADRATFRGSPYPYIAALELEMGNTEDAWPAVERGLGRVLADLLLRAADSRAIRSDANGEPAIGRTMPTELSVAPDSLPGTTYDLSRVQSALRPDEAIVGWLETGFEANALEPVGWGYVVRKSGPVYWRRLRLAESSRWTFIGDSPRLSTWWDALLTKLGSAPSPSNPDAISRAAAFRKTVSRRHVGTSDHTRAGQAVWRERIRPLADCFVGARHLFVIPSEQMMAIPVEALADGTGGLLGDHFSVSYIPSATLLAWLRERQVEQENLRHAPSPKERSRRLAACLAIGDPPFKAVEPESIRAQPHRPIATEQRVPWSAAAVTFAVEESVAHFGTEWEAFYAQSALRGNTRVRSQLAPLPSTRYEAECVFSCFPSDSKLLVGPDANENRLRQLADTGELRRFSMIHIATHALVDDEHPEKSALVLSQAQVETEDLTTPSAAEPFDGLVTVEEILQNWNLDADLVTLSACETGLGRRVAGEGYIGFAHAFLRVGARSLVVSLWKVEDRSTALFMERFYKNLAEREIMTKAEALREAKQWLREWRNAEGDTPYAHPFYWAGFVLIGAPD